MILDGNRWPILNLASYPERIHSNINLALESARGQCPRSIIMNIDDIINNAEILPI